MSSEKKDKIREAAASFVFNEETENPEKDKLKEIAEEEVSAFFDTEEDEENIEDKKEIKKEKKKNKKEKKPLPPLFQNKIAKVILILMFLSGLIMFISPYRVNYIKKYQKQNNRPIKVKLITPKVKKKKEEKNNVIVAQNKQEKKVENKEEKLTAQIPIQPQNLQINPKPIQTDQINQIKTEDNQTVKLLDEDYVTKKDLIELTKTMKDSLESFSSSIQDLKESLQDLKERSNYIEQRLSRLENIENSVSDLKESNKEFNARLERVEKRLDIESKKLQDLYKKLLEKKTRVRIIDTYSCEIDHVLYHLGDIIQIHKKKFIIVSIDPNKGIYLRDKEGNKWLLKP